MAIVKNTLPYQKPDSGLSAQYKPLSNALMGQSAMGNNMMSASQKEAMFPGAQGREAKPWQAPYEMTEGGSPWQQTPWQQTYRTGLGSTSASSTRGTQEYYDNLYDSRRSIYDEVGLDLSDPRMKSLMMMSSGMTNWTPPDDWYKKDAGGSRPSQPGGSSAMSTIKGQYGPLYSALTEQLSPHGMDNQSRYGGRGRMR